MKVLGLPEDETFQEFVDHYKLQAFLKDKETTATLTALQITGTTPMNQIFDRLLSQLTEQDFKFTHQYTVKAVYKKPNGKWNELTSDSLFLDSRRFFDVYGKLIHKRAIEIVKR